MNRFKPSRQAIKFGYPKTQSIADKIAFASYQATAIANGVWEQDAFRGVQLEDWRVAFYAKHHADNQENKRKAFQRARDRLIKAKQLSVHDDVYLIADPSQIMEIVMHRDKRDRRDKAGHVPPCPGTGGTNA